MATNKKDVWLETPYWMRKFFNFLLLASTHSLPGEATIFPRTLEGEVDPPKIIPPHFDNVEGWIARNYRKPIHKGKVFKGYSAPVSPEDRTHIAAHITGVEFGVASYRVNFWKKQILAKKIPEEVLSRYRLPSPDETARRIALHERFWKVPYHVVGLRNGDILFNNLLLSYTWHGNYLNDEAIGLSAECNLPGLAKNRKNSHTKTSEFWVETNRKAFTVAYELGMEQGLPIKAVRCHRQASDRRLADPGEDYYKLVLRPMAQKHGLTIDLNYVHPKGGAQICREWDERGLVDYRGRSLRR